MSGVFCLKQTRSDYLKALSQGSKDAAARVLDIAIEESVPILDLYLDVVIPSQLEVCNLWANGELSVSAENLALKISEDEIARLGALIEPRPALGLKAIVATLSGDCHSFAVRIIADFFYEDGWEVCYLGPNIPVHDLVSKAKELAVDAVILSVTVDKVLSNLPSLAKELSQLSRSPSLLLGGQAFSNFDAADTKNYHILPNEPYRAVEVTRELFGFSNASLAREQVLSGIGTRIREQRLKLGLNQQQLADSADLDRTYLSALENGRKNFTMGALLKLTRVMDLSLKELFS